MRKTIRPQDWHTLTPYERRFVQLKITGVALRAFMRARPSLLFHPELRRIMGESRSYGFTLAPQRDV